MFVLLDVLFNLWIANTLLLTYLLKITLADYPWVLIIMNEDKFSNKHTEIGCFLAGQHTGIFIICHLIKAFLLYVDINYANVHSLMSM